MTSVMSNRNDPKFVEYYQLLADIIGIFWQFHKERVNSENIEFAYQYDTDARGEQPPYIPFNSARKIASYHKARNYNTHRVVEDFGEDIGHTLNASWEQFLELNNMPYIDHLLKGVPVVESARRFADSYVHTLMKRAEVLGKELSKVGLRDGYSIEGIVHAGVVTGSEVTTHLRGLFGEEFRPIIALIISKVRLDNIIETRRAVGITRDMGGGHEGTPNYNLLDNSTIGLNREKLKMLGLGDTLGCPAGMKVSKQTRDFLLQRSVDVSETTMLEEFALMTVDKFDHYLGDWFRGLIPIQRQTLIEPETLRVLEGIARRDALEANEISQCPYSPGKEQKG